MANDLIDFYLHQQGVNDHLITIVRAIARAGKHIAHVINKGDTDKVDTQNPSGEQQLALDVLSDQIFCEHVSATGLISRIVSEEREDEVVVLDEQGEYCLAFDPLDGSSLLDSNLSVGSIFGIWRGNGFIGRTGRELKAAGYILYGPRTLLVIATRQGVWQFAENSWGEFVYDKASLHLAVNGKVFAPGNLRAIIDNPGYASFVDQISKIPLTLRYSGGMVPDIHTLLTKGGGIFSYPGGSIYPQGKLRMLYELLPFAYLAETAGGVALTQDGTPVLDVEITDIHQRGSILVGSKQLVEQALCCLNNGSCSI